MKNNSSKIGVSKKVAFLFGTLNRGGVETLLLDYFKNSAKLDFDFIGIYRKDGILTEQFKQTQVNLYKLKPTSKRKVFSYLKNLRKLLLQESIDIVHAQLPLDAVYAYLALFGTTKKVLLTFHGYDNNTNSFYKFLIRFITRHTNKNIFVSKEQRDYYIKAYRLNPKNQVVIYNGIDWSKFNQNTGMETIRKELTIPNENLLFGMVGSFLPIRNQLFICHFLADLKKTGVNFTFLFIGNKSDTSRYMECVSLCKQKDLINNVHFLGSRNDVPAILPQMDAFIYATNFDTFGIAVVEAMAAGIPVFVNDLPVMKEVSNNGEWATLYQTNSTKALLALASDFITQKSSYHARARITAQFVKEKFNLKKHFKNLEEVYKCI